MIKSILKRNIKGIKPTDREWLLLENNWVQKYGNSACDCYPYRTNDDILNDLNEYYTITK